MINDALYAKYIKERQGLDSIWRDGAFVIYRIAGRECFIVDMHVENDERKKGVGRSILNELLEIALREKCEAITANIHLRDKNANDTLKAAFRCGFLITQANNDILLLAREVKGGENG